MKPAAAHVQAYFEALSEERREMLGAVRGVIKHAWPNVTESIINGMPTYQLDGVALWAVASQKHFVGFYVMPYDLLDAFKNDLRVLDHGRSCIRFKSVDAKAMDVIDRIVKYTGAQHKQSRATARAVVQRVRRQEAVGA